MVTYGWVEKQYTLPRAIDPKISEKTRDFLIDNNMMDILQYEFPNKNQYYNLTKRETYAWTQLFFYCKIVH